MKNSKSNTTPSKRDYWETPGWFAAQSEKLLKVTFIIDAAATEENKKGIYFFSEDDNALELNWKEELETYLSMDFNAYTSPAIFVNPPFSQLSLWIDKIIKESSKGLTICLVHPDTSDTDWNQKIEDGCFMQIVPRSRLGYIHPETGEEMASPPFPSCVSVFHGFPREIVQRVRFVSDKPPKKRKPKKAVLSE